MVEPDILFTRILEFMQGGALALDRRGHVRAFNPAAERMLGLSPARAGEYPFATVLFDDPANDDFAQALLDAVYEADNCHNRDIRYYRDGELVWLNMITSTLWSHPSKDNPARKVGVVALFIDITERTIATAELRRANEELERRVQERTGQLAEANLKLQREIAERVRAQEQIAHLAEHDVLTELPNRRRFERCLSAAVDEGGSFALLYLDLDGFKVINDTHGHDTGDGLLQNVAGRLKACLRDGDTLARLGGDEFAVILKSVRTAADAEPVVEQIITHVGAPYDGDGDLKLTISVSVGIALHPQAGRTPRVLLQAADRAMYEAKRGGRQPVRPPAPDSKDV
ncbi:diguanylate cyclase domain-containing protein [Xanthobacter autotrophicus]|uniref:diguanylate cyclase domain-containing protein n=1 Tax=Xanthobacter autotrophicus TaxID=280 RepID=UPI0024A7241D|nr:diguanylate cyclase [Xanthobacter autotrophicus]MDI4654943.1 diguanylate cyclase [Xanthobacter autotrophicus]